MSGSKKYGSFAGVFTPSLLTILGVIMYMRLGWVVGNAGLWGALIIIFIAHIISFTTGLSISSIATDKKVGAGGVYYVLSRSLGMPIGGAIGLTLFVGTAFSIALYLIGFSESFNAYLGFDTTLDGYRMTAGIALLVLTIIAFISTSIALKIQFFILLAIILSLVSIFLGDKSASPQIISSFGDIGAVPFETVFAIFFPAVTGFTAGIAMSGDLKDPKKAIPKGTMASIIVGLLVYVFLAVFIAYTIEPEILKSDNTILIKIAWFSPLVVAGIWGATLSSALGGILGGPRILQAMSLDKITPKVFAKGTGKNKEPRLALILTVIIAGSGILIGELNLIARIVSMFYLAAYGFINLSFFLESWASSDFRPSFKVNKWIGFVGFIVTFIIMFKLDMFAMFMAFLIIGGIYFWLSRKEFTAGEGDVWQSVWTNIIKKGLRTLNSKEEHKRNWKPNILLFSGKSNARQYLLEFSRFLSGKSGIVTNFDLNENKEPGELFSKDKQSYRDELLEKYGVFGRQLEVNDIYKGIETIASVFGFSGIEPNTVLMGWAKNSKNPVSFAGMTRKLIKLDYNVLYLDYDKEKGFGDYKSIDLWWRGISRNAELTLMLVKALILSKEWRRAKIRIILVNNTGEDQQLIKKRIEHLIISFRVTGEVFIINNYSEKKSIFDLMKIHSGNTDLIMLGIPDINEGEEKYFVKNVNNLVNVLGTTLLVKASSEFEIADLGVHKQDSDKKITNLNLFLPKLLKPAFKDELFALEDLEKNLSKPDSYFESKVINPVTNRYIEIAEKFRFEINNAFQDNSLDIDNSNINKFKDLLIKFGDIADQLASKDSLLLFELMKSGLDKYLNERKKIIDNQTKVLSIYPDEEELIISEDDTLAIQTIKKNLALKKVQNKDFNFHIKWRKIVKNYERRTAYKELYSLLLYFLEIQYEVISEFSVNLKTAIISFIEKQNTKQNENLEKVFEKDIRKMFSQLKNDLIELNKKSILQLKYINRTIINEISSKLIKQKNPDFRLNNSKNKGVKYDLISVNNFPDLWYQIIVPVLFEIKISFSIASFYLQIVDETERIKIKIKENTTQNIEKIFYEIEKILKNISNNHDDISGLNMTVNDFNIDDLLINEEQILGYLYSILENNLKSFPENIEILSKKTYEELIKRQINDIEIVSLPIDKLLKYIVSSKLILPLKDKLSEFNGQLKDVKLRLSSIINILNYVSGSAKTGNNKEITLMTDKVRNDFEHLKEDYHYGSGRFYEYWIQILHQLNFNFDLNHIRDNIQEYNKFIKKEDKGKFFEYLRKVKENIHQKTGKINSFISNKNEDIKRIEFHAENEKYIPEHLHLKNQVLQYKPLKKLPPYYLQLFKGNRFAISERNGSRKLELEKAKKAILELKDGDTASILIAGTSGIGKSWFSEKLAEELSVEKALYLDIIDCVGKSKFPFKDFLSNLSGKKANIHTSINKYPFGTVFIIEDIENYISVREGEMLLLNELAKLINEFGSRYYFLLSVNINSIKIIEESCNLLNEISAMTVLDPLPLKSIIKTIINRHEMGNLMLFSKKGTKLPKRNMRDIISKINSLSKGNPGMALGLWLSIIKYSNERFYMDYSINFEDIKIENKFWLSLLQRMLIFGNISKDNFLNYFPSEQKELIFDNLKMLEKAKIIEQFGKNKYRIDKLLKPFIELWLKDKEII